MERLSKRHYHANGYYMACSENCKADMDMDCIDCPALEKLIDRLGAYEDTGLTPEEARLLARADKEGRVMVLPCKVGDTVYFAAWFGTQPRVVYRVIDPFFYTVDAGGDGGIADFSLRDFGETVFLTRAEAEEALRRAENG